MDASEVTTALNGLLTRPTGGHKYNFGHVAVIGGSPGMEGAPVLVAWAALRTGAGLATIASEIANNLTARPPEIMTHLLPPCNDDLAIDELLQFCAERKVSVVVIGPGLGPAAAGFIRRLVAAVTLPMVLDAGALGAFTDHLDDLRINGRRNPHIILTPHTGEYRKLTGQTLPTAATAKRQAVQQFAEQHKLTLALKGHQTMVAGAKAAKFYQNQTGNPGMATAGTGDVLSGVIAGLLGQGLTSFEAACVGVYLHGKAGDRAGEQFSQPGLVASDVIANLPAALLSRQ
jgi:hydroxyethylthiazole kinase-like uncharacterized protein yjeF